MGEYWKPINLTKREYIHPHDLDCGLKLGEWNWPGSSVTKLINERWSPTDMVVAVSDYENVLVLRGDPPPDKIPDYDAIGYHRVKAVNDPPPAVRRSGSR